MNEIVTEYFPLLDMTTALRDQMMDLLTDADLGFRLPGDNPTLGALCREMGEVQVSYIESFKTLKQDFNYRNTEPGLDTSVARLSGWYKTLDADLKASLSGFTDEETHTKMVNRGSFAMPVRINFHTFREALLIFYGKASVYLRAMGKPLPEQWHNWIG